MTVLTDSLLGNRLDLQNSEVRIFHPGGGNGGGGGLNVV